MAKSSPCTKLPSFRYKVKKQQEITRHVSQLPISNGFSQVKYDLTWQSDHRLMQNVPVTSSEAVYYPTWNR